MPEKESRHAIRSECLSDQPVVQTGQPRLHNVVEHSETAIVYNQRFQTVVSVVTANLSANNSELACRAEARRTTARLRPLGYGVATLLASRAKAGGADRDRTDDLKLAKLALSQLSYGPDGRCQSDFRLSPRSRSKRWWARDELNVRPHAYQACALTT
jgi:hypothetical protein